MQVRHLRYGRGNTRTSSRSTTASRFELRRRRHRPAIQALDLTGGNLSQHLSLLEAAGLIDVEKRYEGRRGRTWITLTRPATRHSPTRSGG
jgi:DNA-binding transcriptional ArsR family regulator